MRVVLVCGDRHWNNLAKIVKALRHEHEKIPISFVVEGGAPGADKLGKKAAMLLGIQPVECEALWDYYGKSAGPIRNQHQLNLAKELAVEGGNLRFSKQRINMVVLAFHSDFNNSRGTKDMVTRAKKAGVEVKVIV